MHLDPNKLSPDEIGGYVALPHVRIHFSQFGEDGVLWHHFFGRRNGFYVDVGCHHPFRYSNTALLHSTMGWRGINIDADKGAIQMFDRWRPKDTNLHMGIGLIEETRTLTIFPGGATNTFDPHFARVQAEKNRFRTEEVAISRLDTVLDAHLPEFQQIDYLNIDVEGFDDAAVKSSNWEKYRPEIVSVELHNFDMSKPLDNATVAFLLGQGYRLMAHCLVTTFFRRIGR